MQCSSQVCCMMGAAVLLVFGVLVMAIFFTSGDANDVSQGPGDNVSIIKSKKYRVASDRGR